MSILSKVILFFDSICKLIVSIALMAFNFIVIVFSIDLVIKLSNKINVWHLGCILITFTIINIVGHWSFKMMSN